MEDERMIVTWSGVRTGMREAIVSVRFVRTVRPTKYVKSRMKRRRDKADKKIKG
jgi:hypothetical protein